MEIASSPHCFTEDGICFVTDLQDSGSGMYAVWQAGTRNGR